MSKITLNWLNDSNIHKDQIVYRSEEAFDVDSLPSFAVPVGKNARSYIDDSLGDVSQYYYSVATITQDDDVLLGDVIAVPLESSDPLWSNVISLLHMDDDIVDSKSGTWTQQGITYSPGRFDLAADYLRSSVRCYITRSGAEIVTGTSDFAIEFFAKIDVTKNCAIVDMRSSTGSNPNVLIESDMGNLYVWRSDAYMLGPFPSVMSASTFRHVAFTREGDTFRLFVDGVMLGSTNTSADMTSNIINLGWNVNVSSGDNSFDLQGSIDEFRFTKGNARYVSNFTPPESPFPNR